ncbi:substrate-binding domain-containing protein, partial [Bacillus sp. SIMBA_026]
AQHLVALGHKRLAFLAGPEHSASNRQRLAGLEVFREQNPGIELQLLPGGSNFDSGHDSTELVIACGATGILAFNDLVAMGLLSGLH